MPNATPVEGRCNAKRKDGTFCANKPAHRNHPTNKRCKFHGGMSTGPKTAEGKAKTSGNGTRHGLYARTLRNSFPPKLRKLYDQVSRGTDMSEEIALMRAKVAEFATMKAEGIETIDTGTKADGTTRTADVNGLLARAIQTLNMLTRSQHEMHPEAGAAGKLSIRITVSGEAQKAAEQDIGDLEAGGASVEEDGTEAPLPVASAEDEVDPLAGLGE